MSQALFRLHVRDGGQGDLGQGLVRPLDALGRKPELLRGIEEPEQVRADPVGAGEVAHLLQPDGPPMVERHRGQRRRATIGHVVLSHAYIIANHGLCFPW